MLLRKISEFQSFKDVRFIKVLSLAFKVKVILKVKSRLTVVV